MSIILNFDEISKNDVAKVGGKGGSLGEMTQSGIPVPTGFVITTQAYISFHESELPSKIQKQILAKFDSLGLDRVAVRSSAIAEDSSSASWAGQFNTVLNVNREGLIDAIMDCWQSSNSETVKYYAKRNDISEDQLALAIVVQKMVNSNVSGVVFSINPVTGNKEEMMIEACYGLGEMLVQGMVTPDNYIVSKYDLSIREKRISNQTQKIINTVNGTETISIEQSQQSLQKLSDEKIFKLSKLVMLIENYYGCPQDIEWAIEDDELFILQSRPVTT
ncbi:MAG: PEP/pyruvate-binding domain-containing protein [bacterium]